MSLGICEKCLAPKERGIGQRKICDRCRGRERYKDAKYRKKAINWVRLYNIKKLSAYGRKRRQRSDAGTSQKKAKDGWLTL